MRRLCLLLVAAALLSPASLSAQNVLLRELAKEDQDYRTGQDVRRTDQERLKLVIAAVGSGEVKTDEDRFNAAIVLQHTGIRSCGDEMISLSADNYLLAHHLAKTAFEGGYTRARNLVAQTIDRHLSLTEGYQRYGTNRFINHATGREELAPIDRTVPDSERAKYGVPPLAELLKQFPEAAKKAPIKK